MLSREGKMTDTMTDGEGWLARREGLEENKSPGKGGLRGALWGKGGGWKG